MAWYDELWNAVVDYGGKAAEAVKDYGGQAVDWAKANPTTAGAAASLLTGGFQGKYGENNLGNLAGGAALGWTAGQMFGGQPGLQTPGGGTGSAINVPTVDTASGAQLVGGGNTISNTISNVGGGDFGGMNTALLNDSNVGGETARALRGVTGAGLQTTGLQGTMDKLSGGLKDIRDFTKKNQDVMDLGAKGISALAGMDASKKQDEYVNNMRRRQEEVDATNASLRAKSNAAADDIYTDQRANVAQAGLRSQKGVQSQVAKQVANITGDTQSGYSNTAKAALAQKAKVSGAAAGAEAFSTADTQARAGLKAPSYSMGTAPTYQADLASAIGASGKGTTTGIMGLYDDITGSGKRKAQEQVG